MILKQLSIIYEHLDHVKKTKNIHQKMFQVFIHSIR